MYWVSIFIEKIMFIEEVVAIVEMIGEVVRNVKIVKRIKKSGNIASLVERRMRKLTKILKI
jgi:hypothetical protein